MNGFALKIFILSNEPESAQTQETGEISHQLIFAIAEFDEYPEWTYYATNAIVAPEITVEENLIVVDYLTKGNLIPSRSTLLANDDATMKIETTILQSE